MSWIHDTLSDFGRQIGIAQLALDSQGAVQLAFEDGGALVVEPVQRGDVAEVLVYLQRKVGHQASTLMPFALERADCMRAAPFMVQVVLRGSGPDTRLIALVRMDERAFTPQALAQSVDFLTRWLDEVLVASR